MVKTKATTKELQLARLNECTFDIQAWWEDRLKVAERLTEIKRDKLYKVTHDTFDHYCQDKLKIGAVQIRRLIEFGSIKHSISTDPIGSFLTNEGQSRQLAKAPPEKRIEVLEKAVEKSNGKVTAEVIAEVVKEVAAPESPAPKAVVESDCHLCGRAHDLTKDCPPRETLTSAPIVRSLPSTIELSSDARDVLSQWIEATGMDVWSLLEQAWRQYAAMD